MNKLFTVLAAFLLTGTNLLAQTTTPLWTSTYVGLGDNSDRFNKIIADGSGNFIAVGYTIRNGNYRDFLTVKLNASGDTLWSRTKNGSGNGDDEAISTAVDQLGNVYVVGSSDGGNANTDILLIKYDAVGTKTWDTTWNSASALDDLPIDVAVDLNGNCIVAGNATPDLVSGSNDYITLKYSPAGSLIWQQQFSRSGVANGKDEVAGLCVDNVGDVYVTGRSSNGSNDDYVTIKYASSNGAQSWLQIYNGGGTDRATAIVKDNLNNIIVTGRSDNGSNDDFRTIKYSSAGILQWTKAYNGTANQNDRALALTVDATDNVYITGQTDVDNSSIVNLDYATVKYNSAGTIQWSKVVGSVVGQSDVPSAITVDGTGNVYVTGKSDQDATSVTNNDYMTIMMNSSGLLQWTNFLAGTRSGGSDIASSLVLTATGSVLVAGGIDNLITQKDAHVVNYSSTGSSLFSKSYNGQGDFSESAKNVVVDANGSAYMSGYSFIEGHNQDAAIFKVNSSGTISCQYLFNGLKSDDEEFSCLSISPNGNLIAGGYTKVSGQKSNFLLVKWNPTTCDTVWTRTYDFIQQTDRIVDLAVDVTGNIYVTGRSDQDPIDSVDNNDIVVIKYDNNGNLQWVQRYNGTGNLSDEPSRILLDNSNHVLVCGRTENIHDDDFIVLKYDVSNGNPIWASPSIYNGPFANDDRALDMTIDSQDKIYVAGYSQTGSVGATDDAVICGFDANGILQHFYGFDGIGSGNDQAVKIAHDNSDNIFAVLNTDVDPSPLTSNYDILSIKFDNSLNQLWVNPPFYDSPVGKDDLASDLVVTANGDMIVAGSTESDTLNGKVNRNFLMMRYSSAGTLNLLSDFDGTTNSDDAANAIAVQGSSLWAVGYTTGAVNNGKDMTMNLYDLNTGITSPESVNTSGVFPNPLVQSSVIVLNAQHIPLELSVEVVDVLGEVVLLKIATEGKCVVDRSDFIPGIYFYRFKSNQSIISSGKLLVN